MRPEDSFEEKDDGDSNSEVETEGEITLQDFLDILDRYGETDFWRSRRYRPVFTLTSDRVEELFGKPLWRDYPENQVLISERRRQRSRYLRDGRSDP